MASLSLRVSALETDQPWIIAQKVFDILNDYLQPSNTTAPVDAARGIDNLTPMKRDLGDGEAKEGAEAFLWELWEIFITIARQIPHDHPSQDRLVGLIQALTTLPPTMVHIWQDDTRVWTDLPMLGPALREAWISPTYHNPSPAPEAAQQWINLNSFAARLLNLDGLTWNYYAIWSLRSALEEPSEGSKLDCDVAAAAQWIAHSGPLLSKLVRENPHGEDDRALAPGELYKGKGGWCPERWQFWKQRLGEIGEQGGGDAKAVALDVKKTMETI